MCLYPFFYSSLCVPWCACRGQVTTWSSSHLSLLLGSNSGRQAHKMIDFTGWSHLASADVTWRRREQRLKKRCLSNIFSNPMTMRSDGSHEIFTGLQVKQTVATYLPAVCWTHFSRVFLALPWILAVTLRLLGGLAVSVLTMLSTEEALLDRDWSCGRLLVSSSICGYEQAENG